MTWHAPHHQLRDPKLRRAFQSLEKHLASRERSVRLAADLSASTSTTLADTTGLKFDVQSGHHYVFEFGLLYVSAATTTGVKVGVTTPTFTTLAATVSAQAAADGTAAEFAGWLSSSGDAVTASGVETATTVTYIAKVEGVLVPSADGILQLQHATEVGASGITPKAGSYGFLRDIT
jgi:hypothetical protein